MVSTVSKQWQTNEEIYENSLGTHTHSHLQWQNFGFHVATILCCMHIAQRTLYQRAHCCWPVHFSAGTSHSPVDKSGSQAFQLALKISRCLFHVHILLHNFCHFFIACFSLCICFVIAIVCHNIVHFCWVLGARERNKPNVTPTSVNVNICYMNRNNEIISSFFFPFHAPQFQWRE